MVNRSRAQERRNRRLKILEIVGETGIQFLGAICREMQRSPVGFMTLRRAQTINYPLTKGIT